MCIRSTMLHAGARGLRLGSVQPCVRPLSAVHMTADHNALRGSGPGHKHAFDDAVAEWVVLIAGSPALHYVLFALPTVTSRRMSDAMRATAGSRLSLLSAATPSSCSRPLRPT